MILWNEKKNKYMYLAYTKIIREIDQINYVYHYIIY